MIYGREMVLAIAGLVAGAAALALLAGFATTQSPLSSFYATGTAQAVSEPVDILNPTNVININAAAGAQGMGTQNKVVAIKRYAQVNVTKLEVWIDNVPQLRQYFKYLTLILYKEGTNKEIKAVLTLDDPKKIIVIDNDEWVNDWYNLSAEVRYELPEGLLFDNVPLILHFQILSVS